jgi:hypothetical protein
MIAASPAQLQFHLMNIAAETAPGRPGGEGKDIFINVISEFIAAAILLFLGYLYLRTRAKSEFAGIFKSYAVTKIEGVLRSKDGSANLEIEGQFDKERYLRGTYIESDKPASLRLGAFIMLLSSNGEDYEGLYIALSPLTSSEKPELAHAKWKRVKK